MVNVLIATINNSARPHALERIIHQLRFWPHSSTIRLASAVGYLMVEHLLVKQCVSCEVKNSLHQSEYGKWILRNSTLDFNISHSGNKVVAVMTDQGKAGIDIEQVKSIAWKEYKDIFSTEEWIRLQQCSDPENLFYDLWTKKESLSKAYGLGMQLDFNKVLVRENHGSVMHSHMEGYFYPLIIPGYMAHVCLTSYKQMVFVKKFEVNC